MKPENILIDDGGQRLKLIDFGMSKLLNDPSSQMNSKLGTPYYISPEVLSGDYNILCDMWSMGVITYVLLSGTPPFVGNTTA